MKTIFGILSFILLFGCQSNSHDERSKFKTIMIKSYGQIETLPDLATFYINLNCLENSVKLSKKCLVDKTNELNSKLISFGINKDDILTTSVNMNKSYTWAKNTRVFQGYNSSTMMFITIRDIDKLDEIYSELLENRNLDLGGLSYSHSKIDSLKNEAYVDALKKASVLADKLLIELPESKKEILKIGNVEISSSLPQTFESKDASYEEAVETSAQNQSINISKGTVSINSTLYVEYQIK
ncbi:SIMPL domain-containing protein [Pontibacter sp. E15-1]|uniref:SIMPL domain-containing protein n=1 Tax=Pontibacter sp. E15-1 TaxID=2919918 RepID=UPI001F4F4723|nr:SIMPL domain-containing protein [Pontibacter sp. E15-1]MCJ8167102.1 SIMPL domain-containing protein [Pontibacter sp. E15-1]